MAKGQKNTAGPSGKDKQGKGKRPPNEKSTKAIAKSKKSTKEPVVKKGKLSVRSSKPSGDDSKQTFSQVDSSLHATTDEVQNAEEAPERNKIRDNITQ